MHISPDASESCPQSNGVNNNLIEQTIIVATRRWKIAIPIEIVYKSFKVYDMNFDFI